MTGFRSVERTKSSRLWAAILFLVFVTLIGSAILDIAQRGLLDWWYGFGNVTIGGTAATVKLFYDLGALPDRLRLGRRTLCLIGLGVILLLVLHIGTWWLVASNTTDLSRQIIEVLVDAGLATFVLLLYCSPRSEAARPLAKSPNEGKQTPGATSRW